jgi:hypothetical protein
LALNQQPGIPAGVDQAVGLDQVEVMEAVTEAVIFRAVIPRLG